jgi:aminopeptidase N
MKTYFPCFLIVLFAGSVSFAQSFTRQDTLRGSITPERAWWDLSYYDLQVTVEPGQKFISGQNTIRYKVLQEHDVLQIDLQEPLSITSVAQDGMALEFVREGSAHFIKLKKRQRPGTFNELSISYHGHPQEAKRAPWDGGFSWATDAHGKPFVATSCQGLGASIWWPNKDHMYDEVDSMRIALKVPKPLMAVANGRLRGITDTGDHQEYEWYVDSPINNYGVNANIADYAHFKEVYQGEKGTLDLAYYVLPYHLEKAKEQFKQVPLMLAAFEHWFGPYPFYEDSFKLVEVPYLGMEHQSSVTYGNQYQNGYLGRDLSGTGWGLKFDFIIIHEAGHEWFANNITYRDIADMWIHESFTAYSENLYLDYHFGKEAAADYVIGTRSNIKNDVPIIGPYHVNQKGSGDMYYKGANMLHTLRTWVHDDHQWRSILRGLNQTFYHQTVTTQQIEDYLAKETGLPLAPFFDQYLRGTKIPVLEYRLNGVQLAYRYAQVGADFQMPIRVSLNGNEHLLPASAKWQTLTYDAPIKEVTVDRNYYVGVQQLP